MPKHKLMELRKIIGERIESLTEEVEIATNMKLNPLPPPTVTSCSFLLIIY
jgi:hypothetical protein